jgi:hypothetical protein
MNCFHTKRFVRAACLFALIASALTLAGCSRQIGSVTGTVKYQGKALKGGNVTFISTEGQPSASGQIKEDGSYSVPKLTAGSYKVCVETDSLKPPKATAGPKMSIPKGAGKIDPNTPVPEGYKPSNPAEMAVVKNAKLYTPIPPQYADPDKTDLSFTSNGSSQEFPIELK